MSKMFRFVATLLVLASFPAWAFAQQAILQGGPWAPNHAPMYVPNGGSQPIVQDSGPAGGGGTNLGLSEMLLTQRSPTNTYPAAGTGTGPFGTNLCDYDAPLTNSGGYHYICLGPNVSGSATIAVGSGGAATATALTFIINGVTYPFPITSSGSAVPGALNNAALKALSTLSLPLVQRLGFYNPGDAPPLLYTASNLPCTLNSGAGDNGSQVRSSNGACWIATFPTGGADLREWGCQPTSSAAVNTVCMQSAVNAQANSRLYITGGPYPMNAVTAASQLEIVGSGGNPGIYQGTCLAGLRQATANIDLLTLQNGGTIRDLCIDQNGFSNTSGYGIISHTSNSLSNQTRLYDNQVNGACKGIGISGQGGAQNLEALVNGNTVRPAANNNCSGFVIGEYSTGSATGDSRLMNNTVYCGNNLSNALLIKDAGGFTAIGNVFGYQCNYGTYMFPGVNQTVIWSQFGIGPAGDTDNTHDIYIDTADSTAVMFGNYFVGTWGSNAQTGANVYVRNTAGAPSVSGLYFRNFIGMVGPGATGFDIAGSWSNINIQDSTICSTAAVPSSNVGISIGGSVKEVNITGNKIGACDSFNGTPVVGTGVSITTSAVDIGLISDNTFGSASGPTTTPINWAPTGAVNQIHFVLGVNKGITDVNPLPIASAASISIPVNPVAYITGNTTITNIIGAYWPARTVSLTLQSTGSINFAIGGGGAGVICNPVTLLQFQTVTGRYDAGNNCWTLQGP